MLNMPSLPFELVIIILRRLPVKSLKRFRCVAKQWRLLIDDGMFARLHLKTSLETNSHRHLFFGDGKATFRVDLDGEDRVMAKASDANLPFPRPANNTNVSYISNSCNGLFLVLGEPLVIWNPFTKEIKKLPEIGGDDFPPPLGYSLDICYGFGYDPKNDDYKVVRAVSHENNSKPEFLASRVHIYSLKSNSWRKTAEKHNYVVSGNWPIDLCGALHAITFSDTPEGPGSAEIIAFSLEREMHYEVKQPLGISTSIEMDEWCLSKIGGCLSLAYITKSGPGVEIWVMKDYMVKESWTKMLSVPITLTRAGMDEDIVKPLVYSKDSHKVLVYLGSAINLSSASSKSKGTFLWQDLRNQTAVSVPLKGLPSKLHYFDACVESLVPLHAKPVQKQFHVHDKQDKKKIRNKRDDFLSAGFKLVL